MRPVGYQHPRYVLGECVSLYSISEGLAYLVEVEPQHVAAVYTSDITPFFFDAQVIWRPCEVLFDM